jgi:hypothetical protein
MPALSKLSPIEPMDGTRPGVVGAAGERTRGELHAPVATRARRRPPHRFSRYLRISAEIVGVIFGPFGGMVLPNSTGASSTEITSRSILRPMASPMPHGE